MGSVFYNKENLHGKIITLKRDGEDVKGVILAKNLRNGDSGFSFRWINKSGVTCMSVITPEELIEALGVDPEEDKQ